MNFSEFRSFCWQRLCFSFISLNCNLCKLYGRQRATNAATDTVPPLPATLWPAQQRRRAATFLQDMKTCKENASTWSQRNQMESLQGNGGREREGKAARSNEITLSSLQQNVCKTWPKALQGKEKGDRREGSEATIERSIDRLGGANCNWQFE